MLSPAAITPQSIARNSRVLNRPWAWIKLCAGAKPSPSIIPALMICSAGIADSHLSPNTSMTSGRAATIWNRQNGAITAVSARAERTSAPRCRSGSPAILPSVGKSTLSSCGAS